MLITLKLLLHLFCLRPTNGLNGYLICHVAANRALFLGPVLTPSYVPHLIREVSTFLVLQSARRSTAEPGGLQLAAKAAGVI